MKTGTKRILSGIAFLAVAFVAIPAFVIIPLVQQSADPHRFRVPGSTRIETDAPGRYYLWHEHEAVYQGKTYNKSEDLPGGLEITIRKENGERLEFSGASSLSVSSGTNAKKSIGYVEVEAPAELVIDVSGGEETRIFSISRFRILRFLALLFGGLAATGLFFCAGLVFIVWGIVTLQKRSGPAKTGQETTY